MRLHVVQHVDFEGPGLIATWAAESGHTLSSSLALTEEHPAVDGFDWLVIMGGPMSAADQVSNPWLLAEKLFIAAAIGAGKPVLGVCLGAQVLAEVLGGRVARNTEPEIGWFPVRLTAEGGASPVFGDLPKTFTPLSWHSDTFELPAGVRTLASSELTPNQAFEFGGHVWGVQFHLEWDEWALSRIVERCGTDIGEGAYVQPPAEMLARADLFTMSRRLLFDLLDAMEARATAAVG